MNRTGICRRGFTLLLALVMLLGCTGMDNYARAWAMETTSSEEVGETLANPANESGNEPSGDLTLNTTSSSESDNGLGEKQEVDGQIPTQPGAPEGDGQSPTQPDAPEGDGQLPTQPDAPEGDGQLPTQPDTPEGDGQLPSAAVVFDEPKEGSIFDGDEANRIRVTICGQSAGAELSVSEVSEAAEAALSESLSSTVSTEYKRAFSTVMSVDIGVFGNSSENVRVRLESEKLRELWNSRLDADAFSDFILYHIHNGMAQKMEFQVDELACAIELDCASFSPFVLIKLGENLAESPDAQIKDEKPDGNGEEPEALPR